MYDAIIIGAGLSGLAAGVRLAHFGRRVCIVERHRIPGGLNSYYRRRGREFDVGLHAVTNYAPKGTRRGPFPRLLRQLRMSWDEWSLVPQSRSAIMFGDACLEFSNDFSLFEAEVRRHFPHQSDGLAALVASLLDYDQYGREGWCCSAREVVGVHITDPLLREMILCPVLCYGSARESDMEFGQFSMIFRSMFLEGLSRPRGGARQILDRLVEKFLALGGELRYGAGVGRLDVQGDVVRAAVLDNGTELPARQVLSSAGRRETMRLCLPEMTPDEARPGRISYVETISVLRVPPRQVGYDRTMVFFNDSDRFDYRRPEALADLRSGVVCSPDNFAHAESPAEGLMRVCVLANYDRWAALDATAYRLAKREWYDKIVASAARFVPDFRGVVIDTDVFTPVTIRRFTGHDDGAVYGSPDKRYDAVTPVKNLFLCGNDQGLVGIVGALLGGVSVANERVLMTGEKKA
jgi:phytoene dehydrogenase-like protein